VFGRLLPFGVSFTATCLFFLNVCAWVFSCGCRSLWDGADAMCNIHLANSRHCPICSHGVVGYTLVMLAVCAPQLAASMWLRRSRTWRTVLCLVLFPSMMLSVGAILGGYEGYWSAGP
jgi:hypothetical protein